MALNADIIEGFVNACLMKNFDNPTAVPECHKEWWAMCCSDHNFVAISAPRGSAKSTAITLTYTLANILFREKRFVVLISDTEAQSAFFLGNIKKELMMNEDIRKFFGVSHLVKDTETDCIVEFSDGFQARVIAKGSEQKLRGINWDNKRPDLIVCDDMENDEIVMNKDRREKFRRWFNGALLPCRSRDGAVRFVGTILHMDSMLERLMPKIRDKRVVSDELRSVGSKNEGWYAAKYKAHNPDYSQILWPGYRDAEWFKAEKARYVADGLGDVYSQEYLNIPIDESSAYFRKSDFDAIGLEDLKKLSLNHYITCDLAVSTKARTDFSVFVVGAVDSDGRLIVKDVIRERMDSLEIINTVLALNKKYDPSFIVFEKGVITSSILPMLNTKMLEENNFVSINAINPAVDKIQRAQSIRARMRAGTVRFVKEAEWYDDLEQECLRFPRDVHDDQVDALAYLGLALDKFVEAPTNKELEENEFEEDKQNSGFYDLGRNLYTGY